MDLEIFKQKGKFYVRDRETKQILNKNKPFKTYAEASKFVDRQQAASTLGPPAIPAEEEASAPMGMGGIGAAMGMGAGAMPGGMGEAPQRMPMPGMPGMPSAGAPVSGGLAELLEKRKRPM